MSAGTTTLIQSLMSLFPIFNQPLATSEVSLTALKGVVKKKKKKKKRSRCDTEEQPHTLITQQRSTEPVPIGSRDENSTFVWTFLISGS